MTLAPADTAAPASTIRDPGSYRDPSGFVYRRDGRLLRQVNASYAAHWDALLSNGFLTDLVARGWLIPFEVVDPARAADPAVAHAVIAPEPVDFVSYPYEWTFGQLQDAALLTLDIQAAAQKAGVTLKDASAFNIQFHHGRPILIDTLSFEIATPGAPWIAYRQFCQHFLAPLALMAYRDVRCGLLLREYLDGLPLDLVSRLLPGRTRLRFGLLSHLHLHARAERRFDGRHGPTPPGEPAAPPSARATPKMSDLRRAALVDSLRTAVRKLRWEPGGTEWADYAANTSYADPGAAELHYRAIRRERRETILPLVADVANPSPGLGWAGTERRSLADRASADVILALALIHHLAIGRNVPLEAIAAWFARLAPEAIVEFVPKGDPMVDFLLASREDVFPDYTLDGFRAAMATVYETLDEVPLEGSTRVLFRLRRRPPAEG